MKAPLWLNRTLAVIGVIVLFMVVIRPARAVINDLTVAPLITHLAAGSEIDVNQSGARLELRWNGDGYISYSIPFSLFFLLTIIAYAAIGAKPVHYGWLALFHFACGFLTTLFLILAVPNSLLLIEVSKFIQNYLVPSLSLASVPFLMMIRNGLLHAGVARSTERSSFYPTKR
jgi:hypothetical protein